MRRPHRGAAPLSAGLVFRAVRFWDARLAGPAHAALGGGLVPTASRFVFSSVMAKFSSPAPGEDVVGDFKVGVNVEDIVAIVESVAEPENLGGGSCVFDGDGRFRDVGEFWESGSMEAFLKASETA